MLWNFQYGNWAVEVFLWTYFSLPSTTITLTLEIRYCFIKFIIAIVLQRVSTLCPPCPNPNSPLRKAQFRYILITWVTFYPAMAAGGAGLTFDLGLGRIHRPSLIPEGNRHWGKPEWLRRHLRLLEQDLITEWQGLSAVPPSHSLHLLWGFLSPHMIFAVHVRKCLGVFRGGFAAAVVSR